MTCLKAVAVRSENRQEPQKRLLSRAPPTLKAGPPGLCGTSADEVSGGWVEIRPQA